MILKKAPILRFVIFLLPMLVVQDAFCQYAIDSLSLEGNATKWYDRQAGLHNTILQHGELFTLTRKSTNSHAYYGENNWARMDITYDNQTFSKVAALYNIEEDLLIIQNNLGLSFGTSPLKLRSELVSRFSIETDHFEYINEPVSRYQKGFFKVIYRGKSTVLLGKVFKKPEIRYGNLTYRQDHQYFLKKDGEYFRIKRLSGLLKLYPEHKTEVRRYKKQLSLRKIDNPANEDKLARLVEYCDNLCSQ